MPFIDTDRLEVKEPLPGWKGRFFLTENMTFAYYVFSKGATVHEHVHPNEEVWNVIEGQLEVSIDGHTHVAGPGSAAHVPPNVAHAVTALADGRAIVVDHGIRRSVGSISIG
jgi:quercetin dioxygenase-like cupin family protein